MRSSRKLELTAEAEDDLQSLLDYTLATWGERQQHLYAERITESINDLLAHPELGVARIDISSGLRSRRSGQHVIFYRDLGSSIRIVRFLHAKMNPATHLRGSS